MSNKTNNLTEEEINARLTKQLNDPNLLHRLYHRDLSKLSQEERLEFYETIYTVTKLKLFGEVQEIE